MAQLNSGLYPTFGNGSGPHEGPYNSTGPAQGESDYIGDSLQKARDLAYRRWYDYRAICQEEEAELYNDLCCYESMCSEAELDGIERNTD